MKKQAFFIIILNIILSFSLTLSGCSGKGIGGILGFGGGGSTVVSGRVSLSGSMGKPLAMNMMRKAAAQLGSPNKTSARAAKPPLTGVLSKMNALSYQQTFDFATVDMYDADHPEWLYPVASGTTDSSGYYTLSTLVNSSKNGASYTDGNPIPAGNYTLVAYSGFGLGQKPLVAVQSIVKSFSGGENKVYFEILDSDAAPSVVYMFGAKGQRDETGIMSWGGSKVSLPANSAIPITFSMPMWRDNLKSGIKIEPPVQGKWALSADWLTATYYLDPGTTLVSGQTYTITIYGEDQAGQPQVTNVYGNGLKETAIGSFRAGDADSIAPTIQWNSPTVVEMGQLVNVTQSFRVESNELLDVNGITLSGTGRGPDGNTYTMGAKPGVLYLGQNSSKLYVYEFMLGEPLVLSTEYTISVNGGKDLSGHVMNTLSGSITTKSIEDGIDPNASLDVKMIQAQVKSVFGKWTRAMSDRNISQWQSAMTGDFYMDYDASRGIDSTNDVNRDGRYSLNEFSTMLIHDIFPQWEFCQTKITGLIPDGKYINYNPLTGTADFEFKLLGDSVITATMCGQAAPKDTFYATVKFSNGAWRIISASVNVDTRNRVLVNPSLLNRKLNEAAFMGWWAWTQKSDGAIVAFPDDTNANLKYSWSATDVVPKTYVLIIADARNPYNGMAIAVSNNVTSIDTAAADNPFNNVDANAVDVGQQLFGFWGTQHYSDFKYQAGGLYYWSVIGLGTTTSVADPTNPNDPNFILNRSVGDVLQDITAASTLGNFVVMGTYPEVKARVWAGTNTSTAPVKYNPGLSGQFNGDMAMMGPYMYAMGGYDVGSAYEATLQIISPNFTTHDGQLWISGTESTSIDLQFVNGTAVVKATQAPVVVPLTNGFNFVGINDNLPTTTLYTYFNILTVGGKQPVINIWEVSDDLGNTLSGDMWRYYKTGSGAQKVKIRGFVSDPGVASISGYLYNEYGPYYNIPSGSITLGADKIFVLDNVEIYKGNNFISFYGYNGTTGKSYSTQMTVNTDIGALWIAPIAIADIALDGTITKLNDWNSGSTWKATFNGSNSTITVTGTFKDLKNGRYSFWSEGGGYSSGSLISTGSGTFTHDFVIYDGNNNINISDSTGNNYYYMNISTTTGKSWTKPTIGTINGSSYSGSGTTSASQCYATISGTSEPGDMYVNWQGFDGANYNYFNISNLPNKTGSFVFTVPLVSGAGSNNQVSIQDHKNRNINVTITTSDTCPYAAPSSSVTQVTNSSGTTLTPGSPYATGATPTINITGKTTLPYGTVIAAPTTCGQTEEYVVNADANGNWTIPDIKIYNGYTWLYVYAPGNGIGVYLNSTNGFYPTLRQQITGITAGGSPLTMTGSCGQTNVDAGANKKITITGTTTVQNGTGTYTDPVNHMIPFAVTNGTYTIADIPVYIGSNNLIQIYIDDPEGWNDRQVNVTALNGEPKPQYVMLTSPANGSTSTTSQHITGQVTDAMGSGFNVQNACNNLTASVGGYWNYPTGSYDSGTNTCKFTLDTSYDFTNSCRSIQVTASDWNSNESHYDQIWVNCSNTEKYSKPGTSSPAEFMPSQPTEEVIRRIMYPQLQ